MEKKNFDRRNVVWRVCVVCLVVEKWGKKTDERTPNERRGETEQRKGPNQRERKNDAEALAHPSASPIRNKTGTCACVGQSLGGYHPTWGRPRRTRNLRRTFSCLPK